MFHTYIIKSIRTGRYYVGVTSDIDKRLRHHNTGANRSTRFGRPWKLIHKEDFQDNRDAWLRERQIKRYKGGVAFKKLIKIQNGEVA